MVEPENGIGSFLKDRCLEIVGIAVLGYLCVHQSRDNRALREQLAQERVRASVLEMQTYAATQVVLDRVPKAVRMVEGKPGLLETELELVPLVQDEKNEKLYLPQWEKTQLNPKVLLDLEEMQRPLRVEPTMHASYNR
jgi:hypothetical protein